MLMFEGFRFMERMWALGGFDGFRQKQGYTQIYPGSVTRRVKTYSLRSEMTVGNFILDRREYILLV
jgi:hypothetical protein